jgi:hypothetical protein
MQQGTTALIVMALTVTGTVAGNGAAFAQVLAPMNGPPGAYAYYYDRPLPAPLPPHYGPGPYDPGMPSYEVMTVLRSTGFRPLGAPARRGRFYVISAIHPNGDDGRLVIDAYSGRIVRFTPASNVIRASRNAPMVMVYQGPTFPPPSVGGPPLRAMPGASRPPAPVLASRSPSSAPLVTPKPRPASAPQKPETAQAPPVPAPVDSKPAAPSPPLEKKPSEAAVPSAKPVVQPTQPLPPVQTME